ncbi:MAG: PAS domain-containing sensor histidine kinase [Cytophagales bacterium]|nr:MAG: PAS domain-containing sensor histidine kinase [Cytophagales bacterium]
MFNNFKILSNFIFIIVFWIIYHLAFYVYFYYNFPINLFNAMLPYTIMLFILGFGLIYYLTHNIKVLKNTQLEKSKYEYIFNHSKDAIFLTKISDNSITDCNDTALKLFEIDKKSDIIGKTGQSFHKNPFSESNLEKIKSKIQNKEDFEFQIEYKTLKNNTFWGFKKGSHIDLYGKEYYLNRVSDISIYKKQEEKLNYNIKKFETIFENSVDALFIVNKSDLIVHECNMKCVEMFEAESKTQLIGIVGYNLHVQKSTIEEINEMYLRSLQESKVELEVQYKTFKNNTFWGHLISIPIKIEDKEYNFVRISDISKRKNAELDLISAVNELKYTNEELDSFVYRASHDLRSPLTSIVGLLNVTELENKDKESIKYVPLMQQSIKKLLKVIDDLILYSRNTRTEVVFEKIDLLTIINNEIRDLNHNLNAEKIVFNIKFENNNFDFNSDLMRIYTLFSNLISNAIKYHDYGKDDLFVNILLKLNSDILQIEIADNGLGIDENHIDKIFNMFYRANISSYGSGLGLYIVKGIVEKLSGKIDVNSILNQGTTFKIELPNIKI